MFDLLYTFNTNFNDKLRPNGNILSMYLIQSNTVMSKTLFCNNVPTSAHTRVEIVSPGLKPRISIPIPLFERVKHNGNQNLCRAS